MQQIQTTHVYAEVCNRYHLKLLLFRFHSSSWNSESYFEWVVDLMMCLILRPFHKSASFLLIFIIFHPKKKKNPTPFNPSVPLVWNTVSFSLLLCVTSWWELVSGSPTLLYMLRLMFLQLYCK